MINLGKSLSVSESDKYLSDFLKEAMIGVYFSLVLCSTNYHGVQFVLGISQGGNQFALVETGIHYQYTHQERNSKPLLISGFSAIQFNSSQNTALNTIDPQPPSSSINKIKWVEIVPQIQID